MIGAAWASLAGSSVTVLGIVLVSQRLYPIPYEYGRMAKVVLTACAVAWAGQPALGRLPGVATGREVIRVRAVPGHPLAGRLLRATRSSSGFAHDSPRPSRRGPSVPSLATEQPFASHTVTRAGGTEAMCASGRHASARLRQVLPGCAEATAGFGRVRRPATPVPDRASGARRRRRAARDLRQGPHEGRSSPTNGRRGKVVVEFETLQLLHQRFSGSRRLSRGQTDRLLSRRPDGRDRGGAGRQPPLADQTRRPLAGAKPLVARATERPLRRRRRLASPLPGDSRRRTGGQRSRRRSSWSACASSSMPACRSACREERRAGCVGFCTDRAEPRRNSGASRWSACTRTSSRTTFLVSGSGVSVLDFGELPAWSLLQ